MTTARQRAAKVAEAAEMIAELGITVSAAARYVGIYRESLARLLKEQTDAVG